MVPRRVIFIYILLLIMTKTVKLIRSFGGYPIGEYVLSYDWICYNSTSKNYDRCIHKDIVEWMSSYFEEVKEEKRPTSWEELGKIEWYFSTEDSEIYDYLWDCKKHAVNVFQTREQAEASFALAQITQILARYDIPKKSKDWYYRECVHAWKESPRNREWLIWFDTEEKRDHFYKHHQVLVDKIASFYLF